MTVDPTLQAAFFFASFFVGLLTGFLADALGFLVLLLDAPAPPAWLCACYEKKLPILKRSLGIPAATGKKKWPAALLCSVFELLLPIFAAILLAVLAFSYCDGVLRPLGVLLACLGFFLWKRLPSKLMAAFFSVVAFVLRLIFCYIGALLLLPIRLLLRFLLLFVRPLRRWLAALHLRRRLAYTKRICKSELALARQGFDLI